MTFKTDFFYQKHLQQFKKEHGNFDKIHANCIKMKTPKNLRKVLLLFAMLVQFVEIGHAGTVTSVTVQTNFTNHYSQYSMLFTTGNGNVDVVSSQGDKFVVTFPVGTVVPSTISSLNVTVNGLSATSVSVVGRVVTIVTPSDVPKNGGTATIVFSEAAKIRNPSTSGTYTLTISTANGDDSILEAAATSNNYTISSTFTTISVAAVTPSTSVELVQSQYQIGFNVGSGGFLDNTSTITIRFPSNTFVPNGVLSGVTVNASTATATASNTTREVVIYSPVEIDNFGSVSILIPSGAGLKNPIAGESYQAEIKTSSENTYQLSDAYRIAAATQLSFSSIIATNNKVNATSGYTIQFNVSTTGALSSAAGDKISIYFDSEYTLPGTISNSNVTLENLVSGFSGNPSSVQIVDSVITFPVPINVANGDEIRVTFSSNAGIVNPIISGNYLFSASSSTSTNVEKDEAQSSNPVLIAEATTTITQASVAISPTAQPTLTNRTYTLTGNVGANGRLKAGVSTFVISDFPVAFLASSATVNGISATIVPSGTGATITVPSSVNIANSGAFTLVINGVTNPSEGTYTFKIKTSVETTITNTQSFTITNTTPITTVVATLGNAGVNQSNVQYTVSFTATSVLSRNQNDWVRVIFPEGTTVPATITATNILIYEDAGLTVTSTPNAVEINQAARSVTMFVANNNKQIFGVRFNTTAGIGNPSVPSASFYKVQASTKQQSTPVASSAYTISGNAVAPSAGTITATSNAIGEIAAYTIRFTPGTTGKLAGGTAAGSSTIDVKFPNDVTVPATIDAADVTINGVTASSASILAAGAGGRIRVTLPENEVLSASTEATVYFKSEVGIENGINPGTFTVQVATSSETTLSTQTNNLILSEDFNLTVNSITNTPTNANAASGYVISFSLGTSLSIGDNLVLNFPSNTFIPNPLAKENVLINGVAPTINPTVAGTQLTVKSPSNLSAGITYSLQISSLAGVLNPTLVSSVCTLSLSTTNEITPVNSPQYSTTSSGTSVGISTVALSQPTPGTANVSYNVSFNTGTRGRLLGGTSTITTKFPTGTVFGTLSATVNGVATAVPSSSGTEITVIVPASVTIGNSGATTLVINGITNPVANDTYTLQVKTSVENTFITSSNYTITGNGSPTIDSFFISDMTVNASATYTMNLTSGQIVAANTGYFVLGLPEGCTIPSSILTSDVTLNVNGGGATGAFLVQTNLIQKTVTVYSPTQVNVGNTVVLEISSSAGIANPKEPQSYFWTLKSSAQLINDTTATFNILSSTATKLSSLNVSADPKTTASPVNWTWSFSTGGQGALQAGVGKIYLNFAQSIFNNEIIPANTVRVLGSVVSTINKTGSLLEITVPNDVSIGSNFPVQVTISSAAGIQVDPSLPVPSSVIQTSLTKKASSGATSPTIQNNEFEAYTSAEQESESYVGNPLPIELGVFNVVLDQSSSKPEVRWTTLTELENYGFTVDRSLVLAEKASDWQSIAFVKGAGYSSSLQSYSYVDIDIEQAGSYRYRLVQQDFDGTTTKVAEVEFFYEKPAQMQLYQNFPNPFNPATKISYDIPGKQNVNLRVYDMLGRVVQTLIDEPQNAGRYTVTFDAKSLASGIYLVRLQTNGYDKTIKIALVK